MDEVDRRIVNALQGGFPLCERPFEEAGAALGLSGQELLSRVTALLGNRTLTRFGPMYDAEKLGGAFSLCALRVPPEDFERVAALVNAHPEVAHNYERAHAYNMWFVLATGTPSRIGEVIARIEEETGCPVLDLPRTEAFFLDLRLPA